MSSYYSVTSLIADGWVVSAACNLSNVGFVGSFNIGVISTIISIAHDISAEYFIPATITIFLIVFL